jgi:Ras-related protein Rab-6A
VEDVRTERGQNVVVVLVGNKTDLSARRQVTVEEGERKASEYGAIFMETSAKAGYNVKPLFRRIATALPGSEPPAVAADSNLIDIKLSPKPPAAEGEPRDDGCAC